MSRLTIDISPEQHKSLKAMAALEGKTIRQYAIERLFPRGNKLGETQLNTSKPGERDHRAIALGDLLAKDEAAMDGADKAAWTSFLHFLEQRAEEARSGKISDMSFDQIVEQALQDERRNDAA